MNSKSILTLTLLLVFAFGMGFGIFMTSQCHPSFSRVTKAEAAEAAQEAPFSPTEPLPNHDAYYPGTEKLGPDEMRVVALGTGMPTVRPKQAAACFLVELGNGDKFLFDIGYGSVERLSAMKIPMAAKATLLWAKTVE